MESQRALHAQEQVGKNFQDMISQEHYKPTQAAKSDNTEYRYDAKEKGNNKYFSSGKKKQNNEQKKKESDKPQKSGNIDILI
jgi:hypothetical protein